MQFNIHVAGQVGPVGVSFFAYSSSLASDPSATTTKSLLHTMCYVIFRRSNNSSARYLRSRKNMVTIKTVESIYKHIHTTLYQYVCLILYIIIILYNILATMSHTRSYCDPGPEYRARSLEFYLPIIRRRLSSSSTHTHTHTTRIPHHCGSFIIIVLFFSLFFHSFNWSHRHHMCALAGRLS